MSWIKKYVGIPFVDKGRDLKGCDCWGLVRLVYKNELNTELPTYGEISAKDLAAVSQAVGDNHILEPWYEVRKEDIRSFDVVVMRFYGSRQIGHVGVIVASGTHVLHTERTVDSVLVPLGHMTVRARIVSFRRHRDSVVR